MLLTGAQLADPEEDAVREDGPDVVIGALEEVEEEEEEEEEEEGIVVDEEQGEADVVHTSTEGQQ